MVVGIEINLPVTGNCITKVFKFLFHKSRL
jgi:hypothetical protein